MILTTIGQGKKQSSDKEGRRARENILMNNTDMKQMKNSGKHERKYPKDADFNTDFRKTQSATEGS